MIARQQGFDPLFQGAHRAGAPTCSRASCYCPMYKAAVTHPLIIKDLTEFSKRPNLVDYADASAAKERSSGAMKNETHSLSGLRPLDRGARSARWFRRAGGRQTICAFPLQLPDASGRRPAFIAVPRMPAIGASRSPRCVEAKVALANRQPPFRLGGRNWSSCREAAIAFGIAHRISYAVWSLDPASAGWLRPARADNVLSLSPS